MRAHDTLEHTHAHRHTRAPHLPFHSLARRNAHRMHTSGPEGPRIRDAYACVASPPRSVPEVGEAERLLHGLRAKMPSTVVETYHGASMRGDRGQTVDEQRRILGAFMAGTVPIVVATCAFGLGINKAGIRQVIHVGAPGELLSGYCQETGRAGRGDQPARCTLVASSGCVTQRDRSDGSEADRFRRLITTAGCRWAFIRSAQGEAVPRQWRCHHCDNCVAAEDADTASPRQLECSAATHILLRGIAEARDEAAGGLPVSWAAVLRKLRSRGSKLEELVAGLPKVWSQARLRLWLCEVLATSTELVRRSTLRPVARVRQTPFDAFELTAEGTSLLSALEGPAPPPLTLPVPASLLYDRRGPWYDGAGCGSGEKDDVALCNEEDATKQPHRGFNGAIRPQPSSTDILPAATKVSVFYLTEHESRWFEGSLVRAAKVESSAKVRFADGTFPFELKLRQYGRFATWVLPDTLCDEVWTEAGHALLGKPLFHEGRTWEVRMWCEVTRIFAATFDSHENYRELEISEAEAEEAVRGQAGLDHRTPSSRAIDSLVAEQQPTTSPADGADAEVRLAPSVSSESGPRALLPWPLRWELERICASSAWEPGDETVRMMASEWEQCSSHRGRAAAVQRLVERSLVLPFAPPGFVIKYRARVGAQGAVELLEARKVSHVHEQPWPATLTSPHYPIPPVGPCIASTQSHMLPRTPCPLGGQPPPPPLCSFPSLPLCALPASCTRLVWTSLTCAGHTHVCARRVWGGGTALCHVR